MRSVLLAVVVLLITACSDDPGGAGGSMLPTTIAPTSTATTSPSVTSSTSSPPSIETLPSTTTTAAQTPDAEIEAALQSYFDAYWECGTHPASCDPSTFTASEGTARANLVRFYADMAAGGGTLDRNGSTITVESVTVGNGAAEVTACMVDSGIVYGPVAPNGKLTIVNNQLFARRVRYELYRDDVHWLVGLEDVIDEREGVETCPASS